MMLTAPAAAAVVIASRDTKDVMRELVAMEKIFAKNKKLNDSSTNNASPPSAISQKPSAMRNKQ